MTRLDVKNPTATIQPAGQTLVSIRRSRLLNQRLARWLNSCIQLNKALGVGAFAGFFGPNERRASAACTARPLGVSEQVINAERTVKAADLTGVTGRAMSSRTHEERISIAVIPDLGHDQDVSGRGAFAPQLLTAAAPKMDVAGGHRFGARLPRSSTPASEPAASGRLARWPGSGRFHPISGR